MNNFLLLLEKRFRAGAASGDYTGGILDYVIYKNPTNKEIKSIAPDSRGIVTESGDLYMLAEGIMTINQDVFIHQDIIGMLMGGVKMGIKNRMDFAKMRYSIMRIVPVQRDEHKLYISESMDDNFIKDDYELELVTKWFSLAKKRNKYFSFIPKGIY